MRINKRIVIIESPFAGDVEGNLTYGRGMSRGMKQALWYYMDHGLPIEYRKINEAQAEGIDV